MKIGVDIDGVLADFCKAFKSLIGKPDADDPTDWEWTNVCSKQEFDAGFKKLSNIPNFWLKLDKMPHTSLLPALCENHEVIFITNRAECPGKSLQCQTELWLWLNFNIKQPRVIVTKQKGQVAADLGIVRFIDDNIQNCQEVYERGVQVSLATAPYNTICKALPRVKHLDHFAATILAETF